MARIDARCTQCGSRDAGDPEKNTNFVTYKVREEETNYGSGRIYGTEILECPSCGEETIHNRCASSVPSQDT